VTRPAVSAWWAAGRLAAVLAVLVLFGVWWSRQKLPDFRVDQRVRLQPGVLLPPLETVPALVLGGETRDATFVPAGRMLAIPVTVPADDVTLRFHDAHLIAHPEIAVSVLRADGSREELERHATAGRSWQVRYIPLPVSAGEAVTLEFAVLDGRGVPGLGAAYLADIVLESEGRGVDEGDLPIRTRALSADLMARHGDLRVLSPPTGDSARIEMDGPPCVPLVERGPFFVTAENVPRDARLDLVLHLGRPWANGPPALPATVTLLADELPLATLPALLPPDGDPRSADLLFRVDLSGYAGQSVDLSLQREGGGDLFVGLRELSISTSVAVARAIHEPAKEPNVLLISVDCLRADRLGCYGHARAATPAIDGLAARGGRYERVLTPSSWNLPNVASLLTGVSPVSHGLGLRPGRVLSPRLVTLAQSASWGGMSTAMFSNSPWISAEHGLDQGFETFVLDGLPAPILAEQALDWLEQASQFQWFLALHFADPAYPYSAALADLTAVAGPPDAALVDSLRRLDSRPGAAEALAAELGPMYDAEVAGVDRAVGLLLAALERKGLLEDTLVVVVGSMGEEHFEHGGRLFGQTLHDEVVAVPLVLAGPGVRGASGGSFVESEPIELLDVTALLGSLGNLSAMSTLQGRLPPPFGPRLPDPVTHAVLVPFPNVTTRSLHASRSRDWLAVTDDVDGKVALFDRRSDPGAQHDLLAGGRDAAADFQVRSLASAFEDWWRACLLTAPSQPVLRAALPAPVLLPESAPDESTDAAPDAARQPGQLPDRVSR